MTSTAAKIKSYLAKEININGDVTREAFIDFIVNVLLSDTRKTTIVDGATHPKVDISSNLTRAIAIDYLSGTVAGEDGDFLDYVDGKYSRKIKILFGDSRDSYTLEEAISSVSNYIRWTQAIINDDCLRDGKHENKN